MTIDYAKVEGFLRGIARQAEVDAETNLDGSDQVAMYVAAAHVKLAAENVRRAAETGLLSGATATHEEVR